MYPSLHTFLYALKSNDIKPIHTLRLPHYIANKKPHKNDFYLLQNKAARTHLLLQSTEDRQLYPLGGNTSVS